jgi:hypothetical protein
MPDRDLRSQINELVSEISKEPENIHQLYAALLQKRAQMGGRAARS